MQKKVKKSKKMIPILFRISTILLSLLGVYAQPTTTHNTTSMPTIHMTTTPTSTTPTSTTPTSTTPTPFAHNLFATPTTPTSTTSTTSTSTTQKPTYTPTFLLVVIAVIFSLLRAYAGIAGTPR